MMARSLRGSVAGGPTSRITVYDLTKVSMALTLNNRANLTMPGPMRFIV